MRDRRFADEKGLALALLAASLAIGVMGCGSFSGSDGAAGAASGARITTAIQTIAGTGALGYNGDGRPLRETSLYWPQDTYVDGAGRLWIIDWNNHRVRRANGPFGTAATVIGSGFIGDSRSGPANKAHLNHSTSITTNPKGGMTLAAWHNWTVKWLTPAGEIDVLAGHARGPMTGGDGLPATQGLLDLGSSAEYDAAGNLYISEQGARRIRKVDALTGIITTFAGTGVPGFAGDGGPAAAAQFNCPRGSDAVPCFKLAIDGDRLYIADSLNNRVRLIDLQTGIITTFAGTGEAVYSGDGGPANQAGLNFPTDVAVGPDHSLYIADAGNHTIRRVRPDGTISTAAGTGTAGFSGDGGSPTAAQLNDPAGVFVDNKTGVLYVADVLNHRIRAFKISD
jgi:DNA-binding beta-propeller fold protein YncE